MYVIQREVRSGLYKTVRGLLFKRAASATKSLERIKAHATLRIKRVRHV
jgi:hypothetical protein